MIMKTDERILNDNSIQNTPELTYMHKELTRVNKANVKNSTHIYTHAGR